MLDCVWLKPAAEPEYSLPLRAMAIQFPRTNSHNHVIFPRVSHQGFCRAAKSLH